MIQTEKPNRFHIKIWIKKYFQNVFVLLKLIYVDSLKLSDSYKEYLTLVLGKKAVTNAYFLFDDFHVVFLALSSL